MFNFLRSNKNEWLNSIDWTKYRFTPDAVELHNQLWHRLFVYNSWQKGQPHVSELGDTSIWNGGALTEESKFVMLKYKLGAETYPIVFETTPEMERGQFGDTYLGQKGAIQGQLFLVKPETIIHLDSKVLNTVQFDRQRIPIDLPYRERNGKQLSGPKVMKMKAWAYIARNDFWIEGHGINDLYFGPVRHFATVRSPLNQLKESKITYYYAHKFEIAPEGTVSKVSE